MPVVQCIHDVDGMGCDVGMTKEVVLLGKSTKETEASDNVRCWLSWRVIGIEKRRCRMCSVLSDFSGGGRYLMLCHIPKWLQGTDVPRRWPETFAPHIGDVELPIPAPVRMISGA